MSVVELDKRYRLTLTKKVRQRFRIVDGQKFFLVPYGDDLLLKPVPPDPSARLSELLGELQFNRKMRKDAEKWLLNEVKSRKRKKFS